jgi:hypothetical protein
MRQVRSGAVALHSTGVREDLIKEDRYVSTETMMSERKFQIGDRVRHAKRPEWGIGNVVKVEEATIHGRTVQMVSVRFGNAGVKTLSSSHADLQLAPGEESASTSAADAPVLAWEKMDESDWLAPLARRKVEQAMVSIAAEARDPFNSLQKRLRFTLDLFRFDKSGRSLIDWAVAQSGLADPLSRFTRQELEQMFDRWAYERGVHLSRLLQDARSEPAMVANLVKMAPKAAQDTVRRLTMQR